MENAKVLNNDELEKVVGGSSFNVNGSKLEILLNPNESAVVELQQKLNSGIQVFGRTLTVDDPNNSLMSAAKELDQPDKIGLTRKCTVGYSIVGLKKVTIKSVEISF